MNDYFNWDDLGEEDENEGQEPEQESGETPEGYYYPPEQTPAFTEDALGTAQDSEEAPSASDNTYVTPSIALFADDEDFLEEEEVDEDQENKRKLYLLMGGSALIAFVCCLAFGLLAWFTGDNVVRLFQNLMQ